MQKNINAFNLLGIATDRNGKPINEKYFDSQEAENMDEKIIQKYMNTIKYCSIQKDKIKTSNLPKEEKEKKIEEFNAHIKLFQAAFEEVKSFERRKKYVKQWERHVRRIDEKKNLNKPYIKDLNNSINMLIKNGANKNIPLINKEIENSQEQQKKIVHGFFILNRNKNGEEERYIVEDDIYGKIEYLGYFLYENAENKRERLGKYLLTIGNEEIEFFYKNGFNIRGKNPEGISSLQEAKILKNVLEKNPNIKRILLEIIKKELQNMPKKDIVNVGKIKRQINSILQEKTRRRKNCN